MRARHCLPVHPCTLLPSSGPPEKKMGIKASNTAEVGGWMGGVCACVRVCLHVCLCMHVCLCLRNTTQRVHCVPGELRQC